MKLTRIAAAALITTLAASAAQAMPVHSPQDRPNTPAMGAHASTGERAAVPELGRVVGSRTTAPAAETVEAARVGPLAPRLGRTSAARQFGPATGVKLAWRNYTHY